MNIYHSVIGPWQTMHYLLFHPDREKAFLIDAFEGVESWVAKMKVKLNFSKLSVIFTHTHFDHICGAGNLSEAEYFYVHKKGEKPLLAQGIEKEKIKLVADGDLIPWGKEGIGVIYTPGHRQDAICLKYENHLFTGDTLFVGGAGRTDLPGSNPSLMKKSLQKINQMDDNLKIYPGHDYGSSTFSTLGKEKESNPFLSKL